MGANQKSKSMSRVSVLAKQSIMPIVFLALTAVRCYAGTSPIAKLMTDLSGEATSTWAITGAVIGLTIGLLGMKFGGHEAKGKMVTLTILSFCLLSVQAIVGYLQAE